ncbi:glycolate oxidase subunit GlcE [Vreelandella populi]|uniref:Glycolate oxidase subunit GlcE n=1 Tax=Vreelandella populi TaxID=2498858 RepID=A0A433LFJ1_9GAMM|nr:glycolate oxidase subunit GlcE [Halomonas populi]RUR37721.1 glycolate oxidase subunit GlcE [Halomonas populi]RUR48630.1 glycolate oxidase subunit GlcE [Halomonas populi]
MTDLAIHAADCDISKRLCDQVRTAYETRTPLRIVGGDTRAFYGRPVEGQPLSMAEHNGIVSYDPVELVVTVRAGTRLSALQAALAEHHQMLPFEPPSFGEDSTIGGAVATGLSGPRRPWAGAARDFVLGTRVITQEGKLLRFGGEVMKNVAGYDLSRLMTGAQGTLGVLADISFKVLPIPTASHCLRLSMSLDDALGTLAKLGRQPLPITAAAWHAGELFIRLEGGTSSVKATQESLGGEPLEASFWASLRDHTHDFFNVNEGQALWRLSLPPNTAPLALDIPETDIFYDWGGSQRWVKTALDAQTLRAACQAAGGHATCYTPNAQGGASEPFTPLNAVLEKYHRNLKTQLDAHGIFNPGRLYAAF